MVMSRQDVERLDTLHNDVNGLGVFRDITDSAVDWHRIGAFGALDTDITESAGHFLRILLTVNTLGEEV